MNSSLEIVEKALTPDELFAASPREVSKKSLQGMHRFGVLVAENTNLKHKFRTE